MTGNHDLGLDRSHKTFDPRLLELFTSSSVGADGVVYLDSSQPRLFYNDLISVYSNPTQPDFLNSNYAFTYSPHPSPEATAAWASAPKTSHQPIDIWLTHGAPRGRLDNIPIPGLMGCESQRQKVTSARPSLCVFGHYHVSYGVERVVWTDGAGMDDNGIAKATIVTGDDIDGVYDFTDLKPGEESIFVNAAWMTGEKRLTEKRNKPVVIELKVPV
jgi:hypothetical protein